METIETNYKSIQPEESTAIRELTDMESDLRMLNAAVCGLRRRQKEVQSELKKPGIAANKERLRELLTELERIARALRGQTYAGAVL